jgi:hypothetical protein
MSFVPTLEPLGDRLAPSSTGHSFNAVISGDGTIVRESEEPVQGWLLISKQRSLDDGNAFAVTVGQFEEADPYSFTTDARSSGM